jgi:endonuclease/exonuclease/phosphatase family metal-dependent hydrolase
MGKALKRLFIVLFIILFFSSFPPLPDAEGFQLHNIKVLDQNMYLGADLEPLFTDPTAVPDVLAKVIASNYPARAEAFARIIKILNPDVICLQEAFIFQLLVVQDDSGLVPLPGYDWDFKQLLLGFLGGDYYEVVTNNRLFQIMVPIDDSPVTYVRIQDQDVILAQKRVIPAGSPETIIFETLLSLPLTLPPNVTPVETEIPRGLSTARLNVRGAEYLIANTHLEAYDDPIYEPLRVAQAEEVVEKLSGEAEPIILAGDFNALPDGPAYEVITDEFDDAWLRRIIGRRDPGFTYGRLDLIGDDAVFDQRIDYVFTRNRYTITLAALTTGKTEFSKTVPVPYPTDPPSLVRLWPSDHLGLFFALILPQ